MNPRLPLLQPYPFEKLRRLMADISPAENLKEVRLFIGEPQHATLTFIKTALCESSSGLANHPSTAGMPALRQAIAARIGRRYGIPAPDAETEFARELLRQYNVIALAGSNYLAQTRSKTSINELLRD